MPFKLISWQHERISSAAYMTSTFPSEAIQIRSEIDSAAPNAQHEPQPPWSRTLDIFDSIDGKISN